jgi:hypothetical protein
MSGLSPSAPPLEVYGVARGGGTHNDAVFAVSYLSSAAELRWTAEGTSAPSHQKPGAPGTPGGCPYTTYSLVK